MRGRIVRTISDQFTWNTAFIQRGAHFFLFCRPIGLFYNHSGRRMASARRARCEWVPPHGEIFEAGCVASMKQDDIGGDGQLGFHGVCTHVLLDCVVSAYSVIGYPLQRVSRRQTKPDGMRVCSEAAGISSLLTKHVTHFPTGRSEQT